MNEQKRIESIARRVAEFDVAAYQRAVEEDLERRAAALDRQELLRAYRSRRCTGRQMLATYYAGRQHWD